MKKNYYAIALLAMSAGNVVSAQQTFTITGHIQRVPTARYVYIAKNWREMEVQDSVPVKNGVFTYKGIIESPDPVLAFLFLGVQDEKKGRYDKKMITDFYLEKGAIAVDIKGLGYRDSSVVSGTAANKDYREYRKLKSAQEQSMSVFLDSLRKASVSKPEITQLYNQRLKLFYNDFVQKHRSSFVTLEILGGDIWRFDVPEHIDSLFRMLAPKLQQCQSGVAFQALLESNAKVRVGVMAPDFTEKDTLGVPVALSSFRGKYVLIDFWASWCHPCRAENPHLKKAYEQFKNQNFTILSVSMDNSMNAWLKAIHTDQLPWEHVSALNPTISESAGKYGVKSIPRNFLIDPSGKIIAMDLRGDSVQAKLSEVLN